MNEIIQLDFSVKNLVKLLSFGETPNESPFSHKQIAEWCEQFWNKYCDIDAPDEIEEIMPILADVETQWDLYLANTYSLEELKKRNFDNVTLPPEWFTQWLAELNV